MKKKPSIRRGDAIEVLWVDSATHEGGSWMSEDEFLEREEAQEIRTVGIFLTRRKGLVKLCGDFSDREGYVTKIGRCHEIPLGCIKNVRKLC